MTWDEAKALLDEGKAVYLPENKGMFQLVMKDGQLIEQVLREGEDKQIAVTWEEPLEDIVDKAKERTDWEESGE